MIINYKYYYKHDIKKNGKTLLNVQFLILYYTCKKISTTHEMPFLYTSLYMAFQYFHFESISDEGYSTNDLYALNLIPTFLLLPLGRYLC